MKLGRFICALPKWMGGGHRRGKLIETTELERIYACPRCSNETHYKVKARKPHPGNNGAPTDGSAHFQEAG